MGQQQEILRLVILIIASFDVKYFKAANFSRSQTRRSAAAVGKVM